MQLSLSNEILFINEFSKLILTLKALVLPIALKSSGRLFHANAALCLNVNLPISVLGLVTLTRCVFLKL